MTTDHLHTDTAIQECIDNCTTCHQVCLVTVQHCLERGGEHASQHHVRLLLDCAQICQTSADFMLRHSEYHPRTCGVCAMVCRDCAQECERMAEGDEVMLKCAAMCRACAESCEGMAG